MCACGHDPSVKSAHCVAHCPSSLRLALRQLGALALPCAPGNA